MSVLSSPSFNLFKYVDCCNNSFGNKACAYNEFGLFPSLPIYLLKESNSFVHSSTKSISFLIGAVNIIGSGKFNLSLDINTFAIV